MLVSVVVAAGIPWNEARRLIGSIDRLDLPGDQVETVFLVTEEHPAPEQLAAVLPHRAGLRTLTVSEPSDIAAWSHQLSGAFTIYLDRRHTLLPDALAPLTDTAVEQYPDAVAGRVVGRWGELPADDSAGAHADAVVWLVRTDLATKIENGRLLPPSGASPGLLRKRPVCVRHASPAPRLERSTETLLAWTDGRLSVTTATVHPVTEARFTLQHSATLDTRMIAATVSPRAFAEPDRPDLTLITADLDLVGGAGGAPLEAGQWSVRLEIADADGRWSVLAVRPAVVTPALLGSSGIVVPRSRELVLDVGPVANPLLEPPAAESAQVVESARGNLLSLPLPTLHCSATEGLDGSLLLDQMAVPARIETSEAGAVLRAQVSGVAGDYALSARFGSAPQQSLGLTLRVGGMGEMSVAPTAPAPRRQPNKKPKGEPDHPQVAKKSGRPGTSSSKNRRSRSRRRRAPVPVRVLRRAVPEPIKPFIRQLAALPLLKQLSRPSARATK